MNLKDIERAMIAKGVNKLLFKFLSPNDNSKNQVYLAGSLDILNVLPMDEVRSVRTPKGKHILSAAVDFHWLRFGGDPISAPHAQLILYPQYPEVRLSGFLLGARGAPNEIMATRDEGRVLFLGVTPAGRILAHAAKDAALFAELAALQNLEQTGAFKHLRMETSDGSRDRLLERLATIALAGWLPAQKLQLDGRVGPCNGTNCGGYTLEAQLGITPNGRSEPDFEGWELKSHGVTRFDRLGVGQLTLMTPEPTGGFYRDDGAAAFVRRFGYADQKIADRLNFSSPHQAWVRNKLTGLTLNLLGYDRDAERISDPHASFALLNDDGEVAAEWHYAGLLTHWNRKHDKAAYVPSLCQRGEPIQYRYGERVRLGTGTDFNRFLSAISNGAIWYDPGIKLEASSTAQPRLKRRSQFRIRSANLARMYTRFEEVALLSDEPPFRP
jgi:hypothetical protein